MKKQIICIIIITVTVLLGGCSEDKGKGKQESVLQTDMTEVKTKIEETTFSLLAARESTKEPEVVTTEAIETEKETQTVESPVETQLVESQLQQSEPTTLELQPQQPEPTAPEPQPETAAPEPQQPVPEPQPETAAPEPTAPKSIYDYEFDLEAIRAELIAIGESKGLKHVTTDNGVACTPDNSSWAMPVTASQSFQGEALKRALQDYVASMPDVIKMSGGEISSFTIYVESIGNGSYTFYFLY